MDVTVKFSDGSSHVYKGVPDSTAPEAVTAQAQQEFGKQVAALDGGAAPSTTSIGEEVGRVLDKSIRGGLLALPRLFDLAATPAKAAGKGLSNILVEAATGKPPVDLQEKPKSNLMKLATADDISGAMENLSGGPVQEPTTTPGKYAGSIGEGAVAALAGPFRAATLPRQLMIGASAGGGSEAGAQLMGDNPVSRLLGGLAGGLTPTLISAYRPNATQLIKDATKFVTDADWRRAKSVAQTLEQEGIPYLNSQLLGPASSLDDLVAVAATHPSVRPRLLAAIKNAPEQARKALDRWLLGNTDVTTGSRRATLDEIHGASKDAIKNLQKQANQAYENALDPMTVLEDYPVSHIRDLKKRLIALARNPDKFSPSIGGGKAIEDFVNTAFTDPRTGKTIVNKGQINNIYKTLGTKEVAEGYKGLPLDDMKAVLREFTPEFQAARDARRAFIQNNINPVKKGLTGDITRIGGGFKPDRTTIRDTIFKTVFPDNSAQPQEIIKLGKVLGPDKVSVLTKEYLSRAMEQATKLAPDAGAQGAPFKFLQTVAGTNAQRQNLESALKVIAEGNGRSFPAVRNGFYKLMKVFESFKDLKLPSSVDRAALQQQAGMNIPSLAYAPQSRLARFNVERVTGKTWQHVVDEVLSEKGLERLEQISKSKDPQTTLSYIYDVLATSQTRDNSAELK